MMLGRTPGNIVAIRPLRKGVISDYTITEHMLKYFIQKSLGRMSFRKPRISICVPSGITEVEKKAVEDEITSLEASIEAAKTELDGQRNAILEHNNEIEALRIRNSNSVIRLTEDKKDAENMQKTVSGTEEALAALYSRIETSNGEYETLKNREQKIKDKYAATSESLKEALLQIEELDKKRGEYSDKNDEHEKKLNELRSKIKEKTADRELTFRAYTKLEGLCEQLKNDLDKSSERIWDEYELTYSAVEELELVEITPENKTEQQKRFTEYKNKLRALGHVNVNAIDEYTEAKERYDFMSGQINDLETAEKQLKGIIDKLEVEMRERFTTAMKDINMHFKTVFRELFGGGTAELVLTNPEDVLTSGIDINVAPPGKIIKNLVSLSGGEQAFVAIALFFAILKVNPTPFCIFDEIESALDEVNVVRFAEYARKYSDSTQFVMITHRRGTMESADTLYGVTMYEKGISKVLTVNVKDIENKLGVKLE